MNNRRNYNQIKNLFGYDSSLVEEDKEI